MCGCSTHQTGTTAVAGPGQEALTFKVEDMTCGQCAGTIARAIEVGLPGTRVVADASAKTVQVSATLDVAAVRTLIAGAGYTPAATILP